MKLFLVFSVLVIGAFAQKAKYKNYGVYRIIPKTEDQLEALLELEQDISYDFWKKSSETKSPMDIMVPPAQMADFSDFLSDNRLQDKTMIKNVQKLIDQESKEIANRSKTMDWKTYHTLDEFYDWMKKLEKKNKGVVKVVVAGKTYEERDIKALEITFKKGQPTVFIEAGIHGREWISPAATSYVVNELMNAKDRSTFRKFNYIYVPFFNPDSYIYTWKKDRLWRKTRSSSKKKSACFGADMNRNFAFKWNGTETREPCSEAYPGPKPFSEVETKSLSKYFDKNVEKKKIDLYFAFQSYGQHLMYPWAYSPKPAPRKKKWEKIAKKATKQMKKVDETSFDVGSIYEIRSHECGSSVDYFYQKHNLTIAFAFSLRDTGSHGFILPGKYIKHSGQEVLEALKSILGDYKQLQ